MEIDATPYHGGNYHPISAEETKKYISHCPTIEQENPGKRINLRFENDEAFDTINIVTEDESQNTL